MKRLCYAKIFFIFSFGCVGCSYFLPVDYGLSIKLQVQQLDCFVKYIQLSINEKAIIKLRICYLLCAKIIFILSFGFYHIIMDYLLNCKFTQVGIFLQVCLKWNALPK